MFKTDWNILFRGAMPAAIPNACRLRCTGNFGSALATWECNTPDLSIRFHTSPKAQLILIFIQRPGKFMRSCYEQRGLSA